MDDLDVADQANNLPSVFFCGQQQHFAVARARANHVNVILTDKSIGVIIGDRVSQVLGS